MGHGILTFTELYCCWLDDDADCKSWFHCSTTMPSRPLCYWKHVTLVRCLLLPHGMRRHCLLFLCAYFLSVMLSTKSMNFGSRYLVHRLSDQDEIWHIDRGGLAVHQCHDWWTSAQGFPWAPKYWRCKNFCNVFLVHHLADHGEI